MAQHRRLSLTLVASVLLTASTSTIGAELDAQTHGDVRLRAGYLSTRDDTPLNPNAALFAPSDYFVQGFSVLRSKLRSGPARLRVQLRPFYASSASETQARLFVDELWLEAATTPSRFLFAGRRNIVTGVAFSTNPTDFWGDDKDIDYTLPEDERRNLRSGVYMAGIEQFFDNGNLSLLAAPKLDNIQDEDARVQLAASWLLQELNTDLGIQLLVTGERPGIGLNLSTTLGEALVVYSESALRRGRDRLVVEEGELVAGDPDTWYFNGVIGGQYTFPSTINLILEMQHNANGYARSEWDKIQATVSNATSMLLDPQTRSAGIQRLANLTNVTKHNELRQDYLFFRISHPRLFDRLDSSLFLLQNLDDGSRLIRARVDATVGERLRLGAMVDHMGGSEFSEFGVRPNDWSFVFDVRVFF